MSVQLHLFKHGGRVARTLFLTIEIATSTSLGTKVLTYIIGENCHVDEAHDRSLPMYLFSHHTDWLPTKFLETYTAK